MKSIAEENEARIESGRVDSDISDALNAQGGAAALMLTVCNCDDEKE